MDSNPTLSQIEAWCAETGEDPVEVLEALFLARYPGSYLLATHSLEVVP